MVVAKKSDAAKGEFGIVVGHDSTQQAHSSVPGMRVTAADGVVGNKEKRARF